MAIRKRAAKRLKVSTGDSEASTSNYVRNLAKGEARVRQSVKSAEERELEEQLFGRVADEGQDSGNYAESSTGNGWLDGLRKNKLKGRQDDIGEDSFDREEDGQDSLGGLADDQLFMMDEAGPSTFPDGNGNPQDQSDAASASEDDEDADREGADEQDAHTSGIFLASQRRAGKGKAPLWHDPADAHISVSLQDTKRRRKLRDTVDEDVVSGADYEKKLRQQFRKIHPVPSWATKARQNKQKDRSGIIDSDSDREGESADEGDTSELDLQKILQDSAAGIKRSKRSRTALPAGELQIHRLRDANQVDTSKSPITSLAFHPGTSSTQVMFTTSEDRRLKLYQVDGAHNPLIQAIHLPELPLTSAAFHPSGSSILLTGPRPFYFSYDLQSGQVVRSPRGLLAGTEKKNDKAGGSMEMFKFSPDGKYVAVAGKRGYVHILDWGTGQNIGGGGSGGQSIGSVKITGGIAGLSWRENGQELITMGADASVYVWDVGTRKCMQRWQDDGGFGPTAVEMDRTEKYFAVGSRSGIVNVYDAQRAFADSTVANREAHKPLKSIMNLTTSISRMSFNPTSTVLALASQAKKDALKLVHLPSLTVFSNWPTSGTPLGHVTALGFSKGSEYLAMGNSRGKVLLYSLDHYANL